MSMEPVTKIFSDQDSLSSEAACFINQEVSNAIAEKGFFTIVLSGGHTPRRLYQLLSRPPFSEIMPWPRIHFFWGDERCVPPDHPDSNFSWAFENFLSLVPLPEGNIHRIPAERSPGTLAASEYEKSILIFFQDFSPKNSNQGTPSFPVFDLILLGLGPDGHTASLFPGDPALEEKEHLTAFIPSPGQPPYHPRITLTLPVINQGRCLLFLVCDKGKKEIVEEVLHHPESNQVPAALINAKGKVYWFIC
jgi:6-phosphogluconolactonase